MQIMVTFRHVDSSDHLKQYLEEKLGRLDKYFDAASEAHVVLRVEKGGTEGRAFTSGIWDTGAKRSVGQISVDAERISDEEYHSYRISDFTPGRSMYLWAAPPEDRQAKGAMWVDRFLLVRKR